MRRFSLGAAIAALASGCAGDPELRIEFLRESAQETVDLMACAPDEVPPCLGLLSIFSERDERFEATIGIFIADSFAADGVKLIFQARSGGSLDCRVANISLDDLPAGLGVTVQRPPGPLVRATCLAGQPCPLSCEDEECPELDPCAAAFTPET